MTKRQLRRLALQTSRYPSWRPVLQDALLEMYPNEFEDAISWTKRMEASVVLVYWSGMEALERRA